MRNLIYKLADGTTVKTFKEAKDSGQSYKTIMENIDRPRPELTEKQKERLVKIPSRG